MLYSRLVVLVPYIKHGNPCHRFGYAIRRPSRFIVIIVRLLVFAQGFKYTGIYIVNLAALYTLVIKALIFNSTLGIAPCTAEVITPALKFRHSDKRWDMVNIPLQSLFKVAVRPNGRVTVLRHMKSGKIKLLGTVHIFGNRHILDYIGHIKFIEILFLVNRQGLTLC